jgi:hypothetical protein
MYIEFRLPNGAGGMAAGYALSAIRQDIETWSGTHNIPYRTKLHKYTFRLCLNTDQEYTQFALTWHPKHEASRYFEFKNPK